MLQPSSGTARAAHGGVAPAPLTPIPAVLGWGTRTAQGGDSSRGGLQWVRRGCWRVGRAAVGVPVPPDTELLPSRLRWIAALTWEIASLPR